MDKKIFALITISCGFLISCEKSSESILSKAADKLNSIESAEYQVILDINQKEFGLDEVDTAICFFDFKSGETLLAPKYQIQVRYMESVFNGEKYFNVDNNEKNIVYKNKPFSIDHITSSFFWQFSLYRIAKLLPEFLKDTSALIIRQNDTIVGGEKSYSFLIKITDKQKYRKLGVAITKGKWETPYYNLFISKRTFLPTQFMDNYPNNDYWKSTFLNINLSATKPDSIWEYERFSEEYLRISSLEYAESMRSKANIKVGQKAPDWSLQLVTGDSIKFLDLKGKLVLLEFWFPHCGACVQATPEINAIEKNYSKKNLLVYGIEFTEKDPKRLEDYIKKQSIEYPTLFNGQEVAKDYGVHAAPTFFLIDKRGYLVYISTGLNKSELIRAIEANF